VFKHLISVLGAHRLSGPFVLADVGSSVWSVPQWGLRHERFHLRVQPLFKGGALQTEPSYTCILRMPPTRGQRLTPGPTAAPTRRLEHFRRDFYVDS